MSEYKALIFFDVDGTLLSSKSTLVEEVRSAIIKLKDNGYLPALCTGRSVFEVKNIMEKCHIKSIVSMNGQYLEYEGQIIQNNFIEKDICEQAVDYSLKRDDVVCFYNYKQICVSKDQYLSRHFYEHKGQPFPEVNLNFYEANPVNQLLILSHHTDDNYIKNMPNLELFITSDHTIDAVSKGNSKGQGIINFIEKSGLQGIPTYAFGDGYNDISMFKAVNYSVAMGNGKDEIKKMVDLVTDTNDNLGIVKSLTDFHFI
ncbi:Cof-type HAD-IIB family hydrolase [Xylocopilactobacillus apicola]|uniref:Haloacid dehalogenase n=1 Tax=Xylocopilactobacillus apicola TaxID=2932184 RepID=A0AAU9D5B8_9LACO|nr:Cof-type HAD-IIB family hydrolase [Xylocopilactobacillus apicola]BDR58974.1 haloacid dehalogenase [Xylocopilactobacillus apicola]